MQDGRTVGNHRWKSPIPSSIVSTVVCESHGVPTWHVTRVDTNAPGTDVGLFDINVKGIFHSVNAVMPEFLAQGGGTMINISSSLTSKPVNGLLYYITTKGAVDILTRGLAGEYAAKGVRVNGVSPSMGNTALASDFVGQDFDAEMQGAKASQIPLGRLCTPQDVAKACLYLASPYFNQFQTFVMPALSEEFHRLIIELSVASCYGWTADRMRVTLCSTDLSTFANMNHSTNRDCDP